MEHIHDFIRNCQCLVLQCRIAWQGIHQFTKRSKVPEETPRCVSQIEGEKVWYGTKSGTYHLDWVQRDQRTRAGNICSSMEVSTK